MKSQNCIAAKYAVAIEVSKTASEVYNHLVNDVPNFWPEEFEGQSSKPNDEFVFRSGDGHYSKNKVVELVPGKKLVWLVTESIRKTDNFEWTGTKMIFELTPKDNHTLLQFTYDGVVLEDEYDRLVQICDTVIKRNLYNLLTGNSYTAVIKVTKSPTDVFNSIKEVSKWWNKEDFDGNSSKLNDEFVICHPGRHYSKQKLVEVVPGKRMIWLVTESKLDWLERDKAEWTGTKMVFDITTNGDQTVLRFTHEGLVPEKECFELCEQGWNMVIKERLFNFITVGKAIN